MENIKKLWARVINKPMVVEILAREYGLSESSVRTNWFSSWAIPEQYQNRVHEVLVNMIKSEINISKGLINDK